MCVQDTCRKVDALNLFLKDSVRLAIVSRPLSAKETDNFHSKSYSRKLYHLPSMNCGAGKSVNPDTLFSVATIRKIMLGEFQAGNS